MNLEVAFLKILLASSKIYYYLWLFSTMFLDNNFDKLVSLYHTKPLSHSNAILKMNQT